MTPRDFSRSRDVTRRGMAMSDLYILILWNRFSSCSASDGKTSPFSLRISAQAGTSPRSGAILSKSVLMLLLDETRYQVFHQCHFDVVLAPRHFGNVDDVQLDRFSLAVVPVDLDLQ